jgi:hypothetical protein
MIQRIQNQQDWYLKNACAALSLLDLIHNNLDLLVVPLFQETPNLGWWTMTANYSQEGVARHLTTEIVWDRLQ